VADPRGKFGVLPGTAEWPASGPRPLPSIFLLLCKYHPRILSVSPPGAAGPLPRGSSSAERIVQAIEIEKRQGAIERAARVAGLSFKYSSRASAAA